MTTFATNWNPSKFQQLFGGINPYEELRKQYPASTGAAFDPSKLGREAQEVYAIIQSGKTQDPNQAILAAQLQDISSQRASELSRQNIDYAVGKQREYEKQRDKDRFTYGILAGIPQAITQASTAAAMMKLAAGESTQQSGRNILNAYANLQLSSPPAYQFPKYFG
jgi:hypothetical protein